MNEEEKEIHENSNEKEYKKLKLKLETLQKREKKGLLFFGILISILFSIIFFITYQGSFYREKPLWIILSIVCGVTVGLLMVLYLNFIYEMQENRIRREMIEYEAEDIKEDVKEDIFENSIKMSYKYLDQYYLQTREQYVTCASGVITEFISAIFFYLYNKTISSMSKYHNKLVLSQNISIALKVAESLSTDDKIKAKNQIINELLKDINSYLVKSESEESKKDNKEN